MMKIASYWLGFVIGMCGLAAQPSKAPTNLGRMWKVHQWILPAADLDGRWARIGDTNTFNVDYTNRLTKLPVFSKVTVVSKTGNRIVVAIPGSNARLIGNIGMDGRSIRGTLDPCPAGNTCGWTAETDMEAPVAEVAKKAAATRPLSMEDLGTTWRVHDFTNDGYDYYGTWKLPKPGFEAIEFSYKNKADGAAAKGSFVLGPLSGRVLLVFHQGRRKYMRGTVQADGKTIKGTADWCRNPTLCGWEATVVN